MEQKKALFLPFMQIPTGHHHVADALIQEMQQAREDMICDKVDILSYSYGRMEKVISSAYLTWIRLFPDVYDRIYQHAAYRRSPVGRHYLYETLFVHFLKRLANQLHPNILFCTHALPSNIASVLKMKEQLQSITVNVYTDYFVNRIWGIEGIDYHLVPSVMVKEDLLKKGVQEERIFITGIPIHPVFHLGKHSRESSEEISILVTGGSLGVGAIEKILASSTSDKIHYFVLCGKNEALYEQLVREKRQSVTPIPYVTSKGEMNALYDRVDAVVTKPGGVTVSECLMKRKPIFVYNPLPGQEKINADNLKQLGLVTPVELHDNLVEQQIIDFFADEKKHEKYNKNVDAYHQHLDERSLSIVINQILSQKH
ncbi:MGDG synthase family glycosyltransferase [Virgibacillus doumboii]|uniref:MGDG synthase family glycosyltransferase n=1 Tax=Virgibacillus doumboii TaxID=2697503 RepID=UPI0013DFA247|nr:glycosyltransferase [Virgibacillus doumboii]